MNEQDQEFSIAQAVARAKQGRRAPSLKYRASTHGGAPTAADFEALCREWSDATMDAVGKLLEDYDRARRGGESR